jgi:gluconolactonase
MKWRPRRRGGLWMIAVALGWAASAGAQDFSEVLVEQLSTGYVFTEGPVWSKEGHLLFSDVPNNRIWKIIPGQRREVFRENSNGANGNTFDSRGRLYTCESRTRRVIRTDARGKVEVLAERYQGKRLNAPNDIVVRKDGHIYFTDPAFGDQADHRELDFYGVYHITPKGELNLIAKPQGRPNGITLPPDGSLLYVANSDERNLRVYRLAKDGTASEERVLISGIEGPPDGIRTDEKGNIYVTAKALEVYSPEGKRITRFNLPETPANCAFGGPDMDILFVTARTSIYFLRLGVKGAALY